MLGNEGKHHSCHAGWSPGAKSSQADPAHILTVLQPWLMTQPLLLPSLLGGFLNVLELSNPVSPSGDLQGQGMF